MLLLVALPLFWLGEKLGTLKNLFAQRFAFLGRSAYFSAPWSLKLKAFGRFLALGPALLLGKLLP